MFSYLSLVCSSNKSLTVGSTLKEPQEGSPPAGITVDIIPLEHIAAILLLSDISVLSLFSWVMSGSETQLDVGGFQVILSQLI